jgi:hypothetical protein
MYVRIRSWHVVLMPTRAFDTYRTRCGRTVTTKDARDSLPLGDPSCETCIRLTLHDEDPVPVENDAVGS